VWQALKHVVCDQKHHVGLVRVGAEAEILESLHHPNIVNVRRTWMWEKKQVLIIEEELLHGGELLDAAKEAISDYNFTITETFAAIVRPSTAPRTICCLAPSRVFSFQAIDKGRG
jgi:hypothetical protein